MNQSTPVTEVKLGFKEEQGSLFYFTIFFVKVTKVTILEISKAIAIFSPVPVHKAQA